MMRIALRQRAKAKERHEKELAHQKRVEEVESELEKIQMEKKRIKTGLSQRTTARVRPKDERIQVL